jgi:RHS repeat-associated protein
MPIAGVGVYYKGSEQYVYQITDHLGNVRATLNREKLSNGNAEILAYSDYYPFGMTMAGRTSYSGQQYRYGYQGQELDSEVGGAGFYAFELRQYDARLGKWLSADPYRQHWSPYLAMANNPISFIDPDGGAAGDYCDCLPPGIDPWNQYWTQNVDPKSIGDFGREKVNPFPTLGYRDINDYTYSPNTQEIQTQLDLQALFSTPSRAEWKEMTEEDPQEYIIKFKIDFYERGFWNDKPYRIGTKNVYILAHFYEKKNEWIFKNDPVRNIEPFSKIEGESTYWSVYPYIGDKNSGRDGVCPRCPNKDEISQQNLVLVMAAGTNDYSKTTSVGGGDLVQAGREIGINISGSSEVIRQDYYIAYPQSGNPRIYDASFNEADGMIKPIVPGDYIHKSPEFVMWYQYLYSSIGWRYYFKVTDKIIQPILSSENLNLTPYDVTDSSEKH